MLVSLLKNNTTATAPGSSCTNLGCFDSTLFQPCALEVLWECFLQQLMVAELWHRRMYESPSEHHDGFSAKTCPWSPLGAFQALIYQGNKGWRPQPLGTFSSVAVVPAPCWPWRVCAVGCIQVGMALGSLSPSCHKESRAFSKGWGRGRSNKGHPGALSLSAGLSICVLVCRAAEQTPGESGAGFLRRLSPVWSSDPA